MMQSALYGKFLGKALPLDQAKQALMEVWKDFGSLKVSNLLNGYYFIQCETEELQNRLLFDGPWTIASRILQLASWREGFQPTIEQLSTTAVWIQIFHLPIELWNVETLEAMVSFFGKVLKIDEHTQSQSRTRFARVCIEINLRLPLQQGVWVKYGDSNILALV